MWVGSPEGAKHILILKNIAHQPQFHFLSKVFDILAQSFPFYDVLFAL